MSMYKERLEDLSVYYFLADCFIAIPQVKIVDGFPEEVLTLPTVAVEAGRIDLRQFEIGNRDSLRVRKWYIDIFAKSKSQRDEMGYKLLEDLKNGIIVYDYNEGFPPTVTPSKIGHLQILSTTFIPIRISPELVEKMYYRATLSFVAQNDVV
jgi:hypothetical protein